MAANEQYGVDLDALDQVVKELNQVLKDMNGPKTKARDNTLLREGALGAGFKEPGELRESHDKVKKKIEDLVDDVEALVDKFGQKSSKTQGAYQNAEADAKVSLA